MTPDERAALHEAIKRGSPELEVLVRSAAALHPPSVLRASALLAAQENRSDAVVALLASSRPDLEDEQGHTVVSVAAASGHVAVLEAIAASWPWETKAVARALRLTVQNGHRAAFDWLLARGADVNAADEVSSSLKAAAGRNRVEWVDLLVAKGARVSQFGPAALQFAIERKQEAAARALVSHLTEPLDGRTVRALIAAARKWGNGPVLASVKRLPVREQTRRAPRRPEGTLLDLVACPHCHDVTLEIREVDGLERLLCQCTECGFESWRDN